MPDRVRIVEFPWPGSRPRPVPGGDLQDMVERYFERGTFALTPGAQQATYAARPGTRRGQRQVTDRRDNAQLAATLLVRSNPALPSPDAARQHVRDVLRLVDGLARGNHIEWRPDGTTSSVYLEVLGDAQAGITYDAVRWAGSTAIVVPFTIPVAPAALLDHMDVDDRLDSPDVQDDYLFEEGVADGQADDAADGFAFAAAGRRRLLHAARQWTHEDVEVTLDLRQHAAALPEHRLTLKQLPNGDRLQAAFSDNAGGIRVRLLTVVGDVESQTGTTSTLAASNVGAGVRLRLGARVEGRHCVAWVNVPEADFDDDVRGAAATATTPTGFGQGARGRQGWQVDVVSPAAQRFYRFRVRPWTYVLPAPGVARLAGEIPGGDRGVPALVDLHVDRRRVGARLPFALLAWWNLAATVNYLADGGGELAAGAWERTSTSSTVTHPQGSALHGTRVARVAGPAGQGARYRVWGPFRASRQYRATVRVRRVTPGADVRVAVSGGTVTASATTGTSGGTGAWLPPITVGVRPDADADFVDLSVTFVTAASGQAVELDAAVLQDADEPAATGRRAEGQGGPPPFGVLHAASSLPARTAGWTVQSPAGRAGALESAATPPALLRAEWLVDPTVLPHDPDSPDALLVEAWASMKIPPGAVQPRAVLSAVPEGATDAAAAAYTLEHGAAGRPFDDDRAGAFYTLRRLGTLPLAFDLADAHRSVLRLEVLLGAGSSGAVAVDRVVLAPARARVCTPTGRRRDGYPHAFPDTDRAQRVLLADGGATLRGLSAPAARSPGPVGAALELPPGRCEVLAVVRSSVPDGPDRVTEDDRVGEPLKVHAAVVPRVHVL